MNNFERQTTTEQKKHFWQSKTFWANAIAIAAICVQAKTGYVISPETQELALAAANIGLRFITNKAIN